MSLKTCTVVFHESPKGEFKSGQIVGGLFNTTQDKPKKILGMTWEIIGEAKTQWKGKHGEGSNKKTEKFGAHDIYFSTVPTNFIPLHNIQPTGGNRKNDEYITLKKGLTAFGFSALLPEVLPSSYEGQFGSIKYYIKVTVKKDPKHNDSITFPFTVTCKNELYANPATSIPIRHELVKSFSFLGTKIGTLWIYFDLPMTGYLPGQQIPIDCHVKNQSKVLVSHFIFSFERVVTFFSTFPCASNCVETNKLVEQVSKDINKETEDNIKVILIVPTVPPSSLYRNSVISIDYVIKVCVVLKGFYSNLKYDFPITVKPGENLAVLPVVPYNAPSTSSSAPQEFDLICLEEQLPSSPPQYVDNSDLPTYEESEQTIKAMENYETSYSSRPPDYTKSKNPLD